MKTFKLMVVALVAMVGLNSCSKDCDHQFIEHDYSNDIVGTWTCLKEGFAEALVFKADGTFASVGVAGGEYWDYPNATWSLENNKLALSSGDYNSNVLLEIIPGNSLALVDEKGNRNVFNYCANDLSDEIIGMWVCNDGPADKENDMLIQTFNEDGSSVMTGDADELLVNDKSTTYRVVGDILFLQMNKESVSYVPFRMTYSPNGTTLGDVMTLTLGTKSAGISSTASWLRVKQNLNLEGTYRYSNIFVSNVDGEDKEFDMFGYTMNFATMDGSKLDLMLKTLLFEFEFIDANTIYYGYLYGGLKDAHSSLIEVDGNKLTIKMSERIPTLKDVEFYAFQDVDDSQMHLYMHRNAVVNFYTNMQAMLQEADDEEFDIYDTESVEAIYNSFNEAIKSINISLIFKR